MTPLFVISALLAGALLVAAQDLPDGAGRPLIAERCASCHALGTVVGQRMDRDAWTAVVAKMIEKGARLDDGERRTAVDYLATHFGPETPSRGEPAPDAAAARTARRYIDGVCSSCHLADVIAATQATKDGWLDIVRKMNGKGAGLSEADVELLADYLARTYPVK